MFDTRDGQGNTTASIRRVRPDRSVLIRGFHNSESLSLSKDLKACVAAATEAEKECSVLTATSASSKAIVEDDLVNLMRKLKRLLDADMSGGDTSMTNDLISKEMINSAYTRDLQPNSLFSRMSSL